MSKGIDYQIPRNVLALLMFAQVVVLAPHFAQLSPLDSCCESVLWLLAHHGLSGALGLSAG